MTSIRQPEKLLIPDFWGEAWGANQASYPTHWQREAGCGPATCANLIWYLAQTRPEIKIPELPQPNSKKAMLNLMQELWQYITPRKGLGVNSLSIFSEGAERFGEDNDILISTSCLEIPQEKAKRPSPDQVALFLENAFSENHLVAFLNLCNGQLPNLESWHWVTLFSLTQPEMLVGMMDQGKRKQIDLGTWLEKTSLGGGFVVLKTN